MNDDKTPRYEMSEHYHAPPVSPAAHDALVEHVKKLEKDVFETTTVAVSAESDVRRILTAINQIKERLDSVKQVSDTSQKDSWEIFPRLTKLETAIAYHTSLLEGVSSKKLEARIAEVVTWTEWMTKEFTQRVNTLEERLKTNRETTPSTEARFEATDSRPKICMICSEHCNPAHYSGPTPGSLWRCDRCFGASEDIPYIRKLDQRVKRLEKEIPTPIDESKGPAKKLSGGGPLLTPEEKATCYVCQPRFEAALISAEEFAKELQSVKVMFFRNALAYALLGTDTGQAFPEAEDRHNLMALVRYAQGALKDAQVGNWDGARRSLSFVTIHAQGLSRIVNALGAWESLGRMIALAKNEDR